MDSRSVTLQGSFTIAEPLEEAFPLFSPLGEISWAPGWEPEILEPAGAVWEEEMVFRTVDDRVESIWFVARLDRLAPEVTYHRVDAGLNAVTIRVACRAADEGTEVSVSYRYVGISKDGNAIVDAQSDAAFQAKMSHWKERIEGRTR